MELLSDVVEDEITETAVEEEQETEESPVITCGQCGNTITRPSERLLIEGRYQHVFTNPHGYIFELACFRNAPGCISMGYPTEEFTWFAGYSWRYALCSHCHTHLGWSYHKREGSSFYGLILNKLHNV
jgi:hypothetical protein